MPFFFGDSTPATFEGNFLEVLRDATAFAVEIAEADETIVTVDARKAALVAEAEAEARRLEALARAVLAAVTSADKGKVTSATARYAAELAGVSAERHRAAGEAVRAKLAEDQQAVDDAANLARERYATALESFLRLGDPPGCRREIVLALGLDAQTEEEHYAADVTGRTPFGLMWSLELAIPAGSPWATPLRVEALAPGLSIDAPQRTGLIKKEVKRKRQKLHRWFVTRAKDDGPQIRVTLRPERGDETGIVLTVDCTAGVVTAARKGPKDDPSVGPFPVAADDVAPLVQFATKVRDAARALPRNRVVGATLDGLPFDGTNAEAQPKLVEIVPRLVAALAPTVQEIAARSLADDELIVRRTLADGQREEIFMPKSMLRDKIAVLGETHRAMFAPLGFEPALRARSERPAPVEPSPMIEVELPQPAEEKPTAEAAVLPPMRPIVRSRVAPLTLPPPPPPDVRGRSRVPAALPSAVPAMRAPVRTEPLMLTRGKKRPSTAPPRPSTPPPRQSSLPPRPARASSLPPRPARASSLPPRPARASSLPPRPARASSLPPRPARASSLPPRPPQSTELGTALKEIRAMAKDGRIAESFRQLGLLFSAAGFAACRAEDRRRALRMLVTAKPHKSAQEERRGAHLAAVPALQLLIVEHHDPADYEMLGAAYVELGEPEKATDVWKKALDLERARDPGSELCGNLMRRVSSI